MNPVIDLILAVIGNECSIIVLVNASFLGPQGQEGVRAGARGLRGAEEAGASLRVRRQGGRGEVPGEEGGGAGNTLSICGDRPPVQTQVKEEPQSEEESM